jgi:hypothetical protein
MAPVDTSGWTLKVETRVRTPLGLLKSPGQSTYMAFLPAWLSIPVSILG